MVIYTKHFYIGKFLSMMGERMNSDAGFDRRVRGIVPLAKKSSRKKHILLVSAVVFLMVFSGFMLLMTPPPNIASNGFVLGPEVRYSKALNEKIINPSKYIGVPNPNEKIYVSIALKWRNEYELRERLKSISDPKSPDYMHFYTWEEFKKNFAPSEDVYNAMIEWLKSKGLHIAYTYPLRNTITIYDTIGNIERAFNVKMALYKGDGWTYRSEYYAITVAPEIPANLIPYIRGIDGLNDAPAYHLGFYNSTKYRDNATYNLNGTTINRRYLFASDFLKMYHVYELFNNSKTAAASTTHIFATKIRVATVLWEGSTTTGRPTQYAPFDPNAIYQYYQNVTPGWIQRELYNETGKYTSEIGWYGTSGTVAPGSNTDGDVSSENELDLEMIGVMAPGVNVTCVYGPGSGTSPSETNFPDNEYDYIANTLVNMTDRTLVAVSNSWGGGDTTTSSVTDGDVIALEAMGVTVFASSGDSATTTPSNMANEAFDDHGVVAVGGTTPIPNGNNSTGFNTAAMQAWNTYFWNTPIKAPRLNEIVWYDTTSTTSSGSYWGTQCGVSSVYAEPQFQNETIGSSYGGRVDTDIAAVANRTIVRLSDGSGGIGWYLIAGTSVACPVVAGAFAEMAAYVGRQYGWHDSGITGFGWIDPTIYHLGYDYYVNGMYADSPPFWDVTQVWATSSASAYPAPPGKGYDEPTGWGVLNAWNFIHDIGFRITSVQASVTITQGSYGVFNLKVWYPYGWTCPVGHFKVYGLPTGATGTFNVTYVSPPGWKNNTTAQSNLLLNISTTSTTPTGTYTIYVVGYTYNTTTGQYGNLTYNLTLTVNIISPVPEFNSMILPFTIGIISMFAAVISRRRRKK